TYTNISSPLEELSDIGSPRADDHEYLMLPEMLEDPYVEADEEEEEEEEHPAPTDSVVVAPTTVYQAPSAEETEPFETDESAATPPPHPAYRTTARISIPAPVPMPAWTDSEVARLLAISSPPASPLSPWSSPPPQIPFPSLPPILSPLSFREKLVMGSLTHGMRLWRLCREHQLAPTQSWADTDRRAHTYTRQLMEAEARMSREAWVRAIDASDL
nr:hypothetical protein [Tanacetum cinerariifolium]